VEMGWRIGCIRPGPLACPEKAHPKTTTNLTRTA
jgi:hypothetical protein